MNKSPSLFFRILNSSCKSLLLHWAICDRDHYTEWVMMQKDPHNLATPIIAWSMGKYSILKMFTQQIKLLSLNFSVWTDSNYRVIQACAVILTYSPPTQNWSPKNWSLIGYIYLQNDIRIKSKGCSWKFRKFSLWWALKIFKFDQRELRKWKLKNQLTFWNHDQNQSVQSTECPTKK